MGLVAGGGRWVRETGCVWEDGADVWFGHKVCEVGRGVWWFGMFGCAGMKGRRLGL